HDTVKSDYLDEFYGPFILIHILEEERIRREHADYINRMEMLFTINPSPHNPTNDNTTIESLSSLPIPIQESDSHQEEIDVVSITNDVLPPSVDNDDSDKEVDAVDVLRVDNFIQNSEQEYSECEDSDFDNPPLPLPPPKPPDEEFDFEIKISVERSTIVKFECIDARVKFDVFNDEKDVLSYFMFVIFAKEFSFLFAESEDTIFDPEKLYLLHMDLYGQIRVESVNGKKYILVIVDDYSRFTWVKFLRSKDKTPDFIIKFLKMIQVRLNVPVCRIRTDNGTEFVNQTLRDYYEEVGISHETLVVRSPQQNGVVERRNRTLIEAARTMLIYAQVIFPVHADSTGSLSSTTVDQDAPSLIIPQYVGDDNLNMEVAHIGNDPLFGVHIPEVTSAQSLSTASPQSIVQANHPMPHHNSKWTKDHPLNNIIGQLSRPVSTRLQLHEQAFFCYYDVFLTSVEPKTYKEALTQS
nr:integrase, catalytic region, zinc finger, CCHC-type, peptidase aspartic, catalytic [Tanacetum cinerariifolium]